MVHLLQFFFLISIDKNLLGRLERGRFGQLLLSCRYKLTPLQLLLYSSITGHLKVVIYLELGQGILIKDSRIPPLKSHHRSSGGEASPKTSISEGSRYVPNSRSSLPDEDIIKL